MQPVDNDPRHPASAPTVEQPAAVPPAVADPPAIPPLFSLGLIALVAIVLLAFVPRPDEVTVQGWRMLTIFVCTVLALMLRPMPGGMAVLVGVLASMLTNTLTPAQALAGYGNTTVWLVIAAFLFSRAFINSGLSRRLAYMLIRAIGHTSLGLGYAFVACDVTMATVIPGNSARIGGVLMPIARSIASIYKSSPGPTATRMGSYLIATIYQGDMLACAMFLTGQAGNPVAAGLALDSFGVSMTWSRWFVVGIVPAIVTFAMIPWISHKVNPPEIKRTPEAAEMARSELVKLGPVTLAEKKVIAVFVIVCGLWATATLHGIAAVTVALLGVVILLATGALAWTDIIKEHTAWDVFLWFGGIIRMGEAINEFGVTTAFADSASVLLGGWTWPVLMAVIFVLYFYVHYFFASVTTHIVSMFVPFASLLIAAGAPVGLSVWALVILANLSACLTHYGTTPGAILYSTGYVTTGRWWKVGGVMSFAHLFVWGTVGLAWWKVLGLW